MNAFRAVPTCVGPATIKAKAWHKEDGVGYFVAWLKVWASKGPPAAITASFVKKKHRSRSAAGWVVSFFAQREESTTQPVSNARVTLQKHLGVLSRLGFCATVTFPSSVG